MIPIKITNNINATPARLNSRLGGKLISARTASAFAKKMIERSGMRKGLTLIELLTTVVLVGIIVTASFSTYSSSRDKNKLNVDATMIESLFNTVRTDAITGVTNEDILPKDYGLSFTLASGEIQLFAETGTEYGTGAGQYNYLFNTDENGDKDKLLETLSLVNSTVSGIYVFVPGNEGEGADDDWDNTGISSATIAFLLPKAELRLLTNLSVSTSAEYTEQGLCLELTSPEGNLKSFVIDQKNSQISLAKTACAERETP
ncbi:MAG: prepilin-type N-terminal cleavage/methylation domain-containing protein [Candidatus Gracilibacteria bacterium]|nr:prepilin-type N-terminal cleavage/methylation domain-containing protein [Candidatus Gracilibacteria bacterium]